ncbi:hypothetical protein BH11BAC3_BH11BAC3_13600 [soil metagenome]
MLKRNLLLVSLLLLLGSFQPKKITWVAIGDSITYLNDHLNETGNRVTKGYMSRVVEKMPGITVTNQGHNGWTAVNIAKQFDKLGVTNADIYTVFLGTNDWWAGLPLGTWEDYQNNTGNQTVNGSFRIIIDKLRTLNATAKIILITPMQRSDFVYVNNYKNNAWGSYKEKNGQQLEQFADAVVNIGEKEGFPVIDLYHNKQLKVAKLVKFKRLKNPANGEYENYHYPAYTDIPFNPDTDEYPYPPAAIDMTYDGLHPSDKGNALIAGKLVKAFKKILK